MICRVYERVIACKQVDYTVVATDDVRILNHVRSFGGEAMMTSADHLSGTDRVAEAAAGFPAATIVVNVQGDEPFIDPEQIKQVIAPFEDRQVDITTLAHPISEESSLFSPNTVKVVRSKAGRALYFSRQAIPYLRSVPLGRWLEENKHLQHVGMYGYRKEVLPKLAALETGELEKSESLEQLRWLEEGFSIHVGLTAISSRGIDTPEDLDSAQQTLEASK